MSELVRTRYLRDGREIRTIKHQLRHRYVELHTSPHEGQWLWAHSGNDGATGWGAFPWPGRKHEPPAATEPEALRCAAKAALKRLQGTNGKPPRSLAAWLEERITSEEQPALFEAAP